MLTLFFNLLSKNTLRLSLLIVLTWPYLNFAYGQDDPCKDKPENEPICCEYRDRADKCDCSPNPEKKNTCTVRISCKTCVATNGSIVDGDVCEDEPLICCDITNSTNNAAKDKCKACKDKNKPCLVSTYCFTCTEWGGKQVDNGNCSNQETICCRYKSGDSWEYENTNCFTCGEKDGEIVDNCFCTGDENYGNETKVICCELKGEKCNCDKKNNKDKKCYTNTNCNTCKEHGGKDAEGKCNNPDPVCCKYAYDNERTIDECKACKDAKIDCVENTNCFNCADKGGEKVEDNKCNQTICCRLPNGTTKNTSCFTCSKENGVVVNCGLSGSSLGGEVTGGAGGADGASGTGAAGEAATGAAPAAGAGGAAAGATATGAAGTTEAGTGGTATTGQVTGTSVTGVTTAGAAGAAGAAAAGAAAAGAAGAAGRTPTVPTFAVPSNPASGPAAPFAVPSNQPAVRQ